MNKINDNIVDIKYQQTGKSSNTNELGMREMQAKAYEATTGIWQESRLDVHRPG